LLPIFRSESQLRLLGQLFLNPDREQTITELEDTTGIPQQTISREIARLVDAGLLADRRQGRMHFVSPDRMSPYFPELAALLLKVIGPRQVLQRALASIEGIDTAYIFGSWAHRYQGETGAPPGDIDLLIIGHPDVDAVYEAARRASNELGQEVNPVVLSAAEWRAGRSGFIRQLRAGPLVDLTTG
jgi:DNA-binding transcriptional ArsR family regulator